MQINPGPTTIASLFEQSNRTVSVPTFQRNYAWEQQQIDTFLGDLTDSANSAEKRHFFGPIVILEKPNQKERMLVDGQQRITTAVMSIAILRDYLATSLDGNTLVEEGYMSYDLLQNVSSFLFEMSNPGVSKFESNYHLKTIFKEWILIPPQFEGRKHFSKNGAGMTEKEIRLTKELRAAYLRLKSGLENYINYGDVERPDPEVPMAEIETRKRRAISLREALTSGFEIHSMVLGSEPDAFILFETLNDRGMKLSPADLLKTLIMSEVLSNHGPSALEDVLAKWDSIGENIGDVPFSKFLRHYLLTRDPKPVQMRKIFGLFKSMMKEDAWAGSTVEHVNTLRDSSLVYGKLLTLHPYARLNDFSETHRVILLRGLEMNPKEESRLLLSRATEALAFRWIACGGNAQMLEKKYQEWSQDSLNLQTEAGMKSIVEEMILAMPNDIDFKSALSLLDNEPLAKFLLRRLDEALGNHGAWGENLTLEHLAPQNPNSTTSDWLEKVPVLTDGDVEVTYKRQISALGNLALLEKGWNSAISNYGWDTKTGSTDTRDGFRGLAASGVLQLKPISELDSWDGELIAQRTEYLVSQGLKLFSASWVRTGTFNAASFQPKVSSD